MLTDYGDDYSSAKEREPLQLVNKDIFRGEGLLGRFLYSIPESLVGYRKTGSDVPPLDEVAVTHYRGILRDLLSSQPLKAEPDGEWVPHILRLSSGALKARNEFEKEMEIELRPGGSLGLMPDWGGKLVGQVTRIAGIFEICTRIIKKSPSYVGLPPDFWDEPITEDSIKRAIEIGYYLIPGAAAAFELMEVEDNPSAKLAQYLLDKIVNINSSDELSKRDLWMKVKGKNEFKKAEDLDNPLGILEEHNYLKLIEQQHPGPGRPSSPIIKLNPKINDQKPQNAQHSIIKNIGHIEHSANNFKPLGDNEIEHLRGDWLDIVL